jgi:predicted nucleic acid-binding protein
VHVPLSIYGVESTRLRAAGRRAPTNDSWIAATAIAHGVPIVTQDSDHDAANSLASAGAD